MARRQGLQGIVRVRIEVTASGAIASANIQHSSGYDSLDQAALSYARSCRFNPAMKNGVPVAGSVLLPVNFVLSE